VQFRSAAFAYDGDAPVSLDRALKQHFEGASWNDVRRLIESGKVSVNAACVRDARALVHQGATIQLQMNAPRERPGTALADDFVLHVDRDVVVVRKPAGISSIIHEEEPDSTEQAVVRWLAAREGRASTPLGVVHRLDKVTSGVMVFARNQRAKQFLKDQFRAHDVGRHYLAVVSGQPESQKIESRIVRDRGDGLRGSTRQSNLGRFAATHVRVLERLRGCCLIQCRLETGRTHQIRIHLSELGHPIVGEPLYAKGPSGAFIDYSRVLLHAAHLAFEHPGHRGHLSFDDPAPPEFEAFVQSRRPSAEAPRSEGRSIAAPRGKASSPAPRPSGNPRRRPRA
jgi:23S rRNA pseudouridine1911/1915/1917 synthase